ncbi:MAG: NapC/NirT family cytochrome c [Acidobacteriaceae bacterium]|jgi:nitrate/TMAO reductase-like tetraheme cytochrome c subunit|nr:NapC/NirT family cytochrome c [Acidobacteriaceae bacterium]
MAEFKKNWLRPFLFYGNNTLSLIGGALTTASAAILIGFWVVQVFGHGGSSNPYIGLIVDLFLPGIFVFGLILIPIGVWQRRRQLQAAGTIPSVFPEIDIREPAFRHGIEIVIIATVINFVILGTASYRGVSYMDKPSFCGQACHVMYPQWTAYQVSPHSHVDCVQCHIGAGFNEFVRAKVNGTKQLIEVTFHHYPTPIEPPLSALRPARATCEQCHAPTRFIGEKLLVKTSYADDATNSMTRTMLALHLGGVDSLSHTSGIHGHHLANYEYIATDATDQTIIAVNAPNPDGSVTQYLSTDWKGPVKGVTRHMDCMDCHNQASHAFQTPEAALNRAMVDGSPSTSLPFIHKEGLDLIKATYSSQKEAAAKITAGLQDFYRTQYPDVWASQRGNIDAAAKSLVAIYQRNVFPDMKVTWGTYPDNIGHTAFPGCFRCHDGNHTSKDGKTISNDCSVCHNLITVDDPNPKQLSEIGFQ